MTHPLQDVTDELLDDLAGLRFGEPVTHVYNPLTYAREPWDRYLERYGDSPKEAVFLGMNPGPWGMAQTGIPFGEVTLVRDWLRLTKAIHPPAVQHPQRPILGLDCPRSEVSGTRLWGAIRDHFGEPERFFAQFFVQFLNQLFAFFA